MPTAFSSFSRHWPSAGRLPISPRCTLLAGSPTHSGRKPMIKVKVSLSSPLLACLTYVSFAMFKLKTRVYTCSDKSILCILNRVFRNCFCYVRPSTKHVYAHQLPPLHLENLLPPANSIATSPSSLKACQLYQFFPTHTFSSLIRGTKKIQRCLLQCQQ